MITTNFVLGVVMLVSAIFLIGIFIWLTCTKSEWFLLAVLGSAFALIAPGLSIVLTTPTKSDVLDGKAHYVKELNISVDNEEKLYTIVTYQIYFNKPK